MPGTAASIREASARPSPARRSTRPTRPCRSSSTPWRCCGQGASPWWCRGRGPRRCAPRTRRRLRRPLHRPGRARRRGRPRRLRQHGQGERARRHLLRRRWLAAQRRQRHGVRHRPSLLGPEPAPGHAGADRRAGRHERAGLGDPRPRGGRRQPARRAGTHHGGRRLRAPAAARAGRTRLLDDAEPDAGRAHRAALHHRPLRGHHGRQPVGQQVIAGGLAQAIEQYFAPPATTGQNSEAARPTRHTGRAAGQPEEPLRSGERTLRSGPARSRPSAGRRR